LLTSAIEELMKDEESSRVDEASLCMPICVSLQLCLVKLLESWNIKASAVVSHSGGEAAAAYVAGALTFSEAVAIPYYRFALSEKYDDTIMTQGSMLAVGLGAEEVAPYLELLSAGKAVVACINSPSSVTVSGDDIAINEIEQRCAGAGVFARKLKVNAAYHSHHMLPMADGYLKRLKSVIAPKKGSASVVYGSPVTGNIVKDLSSLDASNFVRNLLQPVLFSSALQSVCSVSLADGGIHTLVELGPHSALAGPVRQTLKLSSLKDRDISYVSCLTRGKDAVWTAQNLAATLLCKGYPVDLDAVNSSEKRELSAWRVLTDLPAYPWNHNVKYWKEPRLNVSHRHRKHAPSTILGRSVPGANLLAPSWRHFLRLSDMPWLEGHLIQNVVVFPAAGFVSMAIEGLRQITEPSGRPIVKYELRDVDFLNALVIPDTAEGVEVQFSFSQCSNNELDDRSWWECNLYSVQQTGDSWLHHSSGRIRAEFGSSNSPGWGKGMERSMKMDFGDSWLNHGNTLTPENLLKHFQSMDGHYGPFFKTISGVMTDEHRSVTTFEVQDPEARISHAITVPEHITHPSTLHSIFQAAFCVLRDDPYQDSTLVPRSISYIYVSNDMSAYTAHRFKAWTENQHQERGGFSSTTTVTNADDTSCDPVMKIERLFCQSIALTPTKKHAQDKARTCFKMSWHPDWTLMAFPDIRKSLTFMPDPEEVAISKDLVRASFHFLHDVLAELTDVDIANLIPYHKMMFQWMLKIDRQAMAGELAEGSASWAAAGELSKQTLYDKVATATVNGRILCRVCHSLGDILRQKVTPLELMMEGNLLYDFYVDAIRASRSYSQVERLVKHFVHKTPYGKILEIGGGTGGCTRSVLEGLTTDSVGGPRFHLSHYDFTDVSAGFFEQASTKFVKWGSVMSFKKLDIEVDPVAQSFEPGSYDLIIACLVLHATKDMVTTMSNVHKLLKPGGKLIMIETTTDTVDMQLTLGPLPGWWAGANDGRTSSPNMSVQTWSSLLVETGFSGLDIEVGDCEDSAHNSYSTILTTATGTQPKYPDEISIIWPTGCVSLPEDQSAWLTGFKKSLHESTGIQIVIEDLENFDPKKKFCISFLEIFKPFLYDLNSHSFHHLQQIVANVEGVVWVSAGGLIDGAAPEYGLHQGLFHTLRIERPNQRFISLDLEPAKSIWTDKTSQIVQQIIMASFNLNEDRDQIDSEFAVKNSCIHIPRFYDDPEENANLSITTKSSQHEMAKFVGSSIPLRIDLETAANLNSLRFIENRIAYEPLPDDYIEIEPKVFGINSRDVFTALGHIEGNHLGYECSGIVTRMGQGTHESQFKLGDRVCAVMQGHFGTSVRVHRTWASRVPDEMSFEEAASIPMAYMTAYHSLIVSAVLRAGETVLIHAASGGVGQAAIMLAKQKGAEIYVTVGTEAKRDFIMQTYGIAEDHIFSSRESSFAAGIMAATKGRGVDVILNSLSGNMLKESWNCIGEFGRFIEIGKRDIEQNKFLEMAPLRRAASFIAIDLNRLIRLRSHSIAKAMREVMSLGSKGYIKAPTPITRFGISEMTNAFRLVQSGEHIGKVLCVPSPDDVVKVCILHF
jgi:acyl transferase domain-containing protein/NADPH:quinone reductase-like Zn-dependent oxidoreductase